MYKFVSVWLNLAFFFFHVYDLFIGSRRLITRVVYLRQLSTLSLYLPQRMNRLRRHVHSSKYSFSIQFVRYVTTTVGCHSCTRIYIWNQTDLFPKVKLRLKQTLMSITGAILILAKSSTSEYALFMMEISFLGSLTQACWQILAGDILFIIARCLKSK